MHTVYGHGSALCSFSGPRLHQEHLPRLCTSDIGGGGVSGEGVLAAQWSVWATSGRLWVISARPVLAWTRPHTPAVPREAWGRRVSLHRDRTLWGSLVRVCPAIQRLPVCLPGRLGSTSEFLWLPFRLRLCCFSTTEPCQPLSTGSLTPVLALWDPCDVVMCQQGGIQHHQQGRSYWKTHLEEQNRGKQQGLLHWGSERAGLCLPPITALCPGRLRRGWVAALSLCFSQHQPSFTLLALCDNCPLNWGGREGWSTAICNWHFVPVNRLVRVWLWGYFYSDSSALKFQILFALSIYMCCALHVTFELNVFASGLLFW